MATVKDNSGVLFKNSKKEEGNPKHPDYTGDLLIGGVRYRLAGWIKESSRGKRTSAMRGASLYAQMMHDSLDSHIRNYPRKIRYD